MPSQNIFVYRYRDDLYKVIRLMDNSPNRLRDSDTDNLSNDEKTLDNIRRASRMIESYGLCNEWDWFVTLTLDKSKRNRLDLDEFRDKFMQMLRDIRKRTNQPIHALLVPELHENAKGWHMHALMRGLPESELRKFTLEEKLSGYLRRKLKDGATIYDWPEYRRKFGFVDVEPIGNRDAATRYIKKYITKGLNATASHLQLGKHLYFVTKGLKLPMKWERASFSSPENKALPSFLDYVPPAAKYNWDYGQAEWYQLTDELVQQSKNCADYNRFVSVKDSDDESP